MAILLAVFISVAAICAAEETTWSLLLEQGLEFKDKGHYQEARALIQRALGEAEKFGPSDPRLAVSLIEAGLIELIFGKAADSERLLRRALEMLETQPNASTYLGNALNSLSLVYLKQGRYAEAEKLQKRSLDLVIRSMGPRDPNVGLMMANLAGTRWSRGDTAGAKVLYEQSTQILPKDDPTRASNQANLGLLSLELNEPERARDFLNLAIPAMESFLGVEHPDLIAPLYNMAHAYLRLKQPVEAEAALRRALRISEDRVGAGDPDLPKILVALAMVRRKAGDTKQAREFESRARTAQADSDDRSAARARIHISDLLNERRK